MMNRLKSAVVVGLLCTLGAARADLGPKVVAFCKGHVDEQVGNGQCAVLAGQALKAAGAKGRGGKDSPSKGDYNWGELALVVEAGAAGEPPKFSSGSFADIRPGDIIQLRDVKLFHKTAHSWSRQGAEHHTAVVTSTDADGKTVHVFQSNFGGKLTVRPGSFRLDDLTEGWMRFYHPIPAGSKD